MFCDDIEGQVGFGLKWTAGQREGREHLNEDNAGLREGGSKYSLFAGCTL